MMLDFYAGIVKLIRTASRLPAFLATTLGIGTSPALQVGVTIVAATFLPITLAAHRPSEVRVCPDPADLFIDILAKVGYVEDAATIVESRVS